MQIGAIAKQTGLTVDAIRFYERSGLLPRAPRSAGGFRRYNAAAVDSLRFLRQMQAQGFSLDEIRQLLSLRGDQTHACEHVRDLLAGKLAAVRARQSELRKLENDLRHALSRCRRRLRAKTPGAHHCPLLERAPRRRRLRA